jgi:hypothetical protein
MKVVAPVRLKRKRAPEGTPPPESTAPESTAPESTALESTAPTAPESTAPESTAPTAPPTANTPDTGGLLRKSAVRRWLKKEFDLPLQIREAFFTAMEAKLSDDLRRSVARARELKRSTLMAPDA